MYQTFSWPLHHQIKVALKIPGSFFLQLYGSFSLWIHPCKVIQDSLKLCIPCCVFRIWFPCKWNMDSGIQIPDSFEEFRIPCTEFQISLHGASEYSRLSSLLERSVDAAHFFIGTFLCCLCSTSTWNFLLWSCMEDLNTWRQLILSLPKLWCGPKNSSPGKFTYMYVWHKFSGKLEFQNEVWKMRIHY